VCFAASRQVGTSSLTARLSQICTKKGIKTDMRALAKLCEMTNGDIRACIGTLQFVAGQTKLFRLEDISSNNAVGQKDLVFSLSLSCSLLH
jgi:chromosome transmission fidelity protein 18